MRKRKTIVGLLIGLAVSLGVSATALAPVGCVWDCGDANGAVDVPDLLALLSQWGGPGTCDFDGNGAVDVLDLLDLLANWGPCP